MSTHDTADDKGYFSIEDECIIRCEFMTHEEKKALVQKLHQGIAPYPDPERFYLSLETQIQEKLQKLKGSQLVLEEVLSLMNQKINVLASHVNSEKSHMMDQDPQEVTLSASGISFETQEPVALGHDCQLEIILLPKQTYMVAYGHVVSCENFEPEDERLASEHKRHRISVDFDALREEDSERLIQHILRLEAHRIRQSRQSRT